MDIFSISSIALAIKIMVRKNYADAILRLPDQHNSIISAIVIARSDRQEDNDETEQPEVRL